MGNARDNLVAESLGLVHRIARRYAGRGVALEELISAGTIALIRAAGKFDRRRGTPFSSYAAWSVESAVIRALRTGGDLIRVPRDQRADHPIEIVSMDAPVMDDEGAESTLHEVIADPNQPLPDEELLHTEVRHRLAKALWPLDQRSRTVLVLHYGLFGADREYTLEEIAGRMGVSRQRVEQVRNRALRRLREKVDLYKAQLV
jgi:RNA polymerase primary sigma factor